MNWFAVVSLIASYLSASLAVVSLVRNPRNRVNLTFSVAALFYAWWALFFAGAVASDHLDEAQTLYRWSFWGWNTLPAWVLALLLSFTRFSNPTVIAWVAPVLGALAVFHLPPLAAQVLERDFVVRPGGNLWTPSAGGWSLVYGIVVGVADLAAAAAWVVAYRQIRSPRDRRSLALVGGLVLGCTAANFVVNFLLGTLGVRIPSFGHLAWVAGIVAVFFLVDRHQLFQDDEDVLRRAVVDVVQDPVFFLDADRRLLRCNRAAEGLLPPGPALGQPLGSLLRAPGLDALWAQAQGSRVPTRESLVVGERTCVVVLSVSTDRSGLPLGAIAVVQDLDPVSAWAHHHGLSPREQALVVLVVQGLSNQQIADQLFISLSTVKTHLYRIFRKTRARSRSELQAQLWGADHGARTAVGQKTDSTDSNL